MVFNNKSEVTENNSPETQPTSLDESQTSYSYTTGIMGVTWALTLEGQGKAS